MGQTVEIGGGRIRLRDWALEDLPAYQHWLQPDQEWYRHDGRWWGPPRVETIEARIEKLRRAILDADWLVPRKQVVIADLVTDQFIGTTHWNWKLKETHWRNVGIDIYDPRCIGRVIVDERGAVLGLIRGHPRYEGHVWELLPLAVRPEHQRKGIGRALVADLEQRVREGGVLTLWLGTDDLDDQTTLSAVDLYPGPLEHLARIRNLRGHPFEFYKEMGFVTVGVTVDANGWGKPDIFMAKRVRPGGGS